MLSLAEVQETARTRTIDLRGRNLGSMSNLQNERIPMTLVDAKGNGRPGVFTKPTHVRVKAMADTPEQLRFMLRGRGLSRDEINAAVGRLNDLQDGIEKGKVKVIPDDQIGRRDIKEYYPKGKNAANLFKQLDEYLNKQIKLHRDPDKPFKPMPKQTKPELGEVASADRQGTVAGLTDSLGKVSRLVRNKEKDFNVDKLTKTFRGSRQANQERRELENRRSEKAQNNPEQGPAAHA